MLEKSPKAFIDIKAFFLCLEKGKKEKYCPLKHNVFIYVSNSLFKEYS